jgi:hypothetical protein
MFEFLYNGNFRCFFFMERIISNLHEYWNLDFGCLRADETIQFIRISFLPAIIYERRNRQLF